jgi:NADPH2 dehydrogenase
VIDSVRQPALARLRETLIAAHRERFGANADGDLHVGLQLTHSGRYSRPAATGPEPRVAYHHPQLDRRFPAGVRLLSDDEMDRLVETFVAAARLAWDAGYAFVDVKHCHGYLLHEFLSAFTRPGKYGGSFENRTRILREIVGGIGGKIDVAVRLSAFDFVPFKQPGIPEEFSAPYRAGFGTNPDNPLQYDLTEPIQFIRLCAELGVKIINLSAGSPYYNPHIQRPAAYPPSDGYPPPEDPLIGVARQIEVVRQLKAAAPPNMVIVGTAYSYLQEYLPHVAQAVVRQGWTDMIGLGRMVLSYPTLFADAFQTGALSNKLICRTFSDCTTGPRNGMISGCYPLDKHYAAKPEFQKIKEIKKRAGA